MHFLRIITVLAAALAAAFVEASFPSRSEEAESGPLVVRIENGPLAAQPAAQAMLAKAGHHGRLTVIVGLAFRLEDRLTEAGEYAQWRRLDETQEALIARAAIARRDRIWKLQVVPAFVAQVSRAELARLLADPAVARVSEDFPLSLQLKESTKLVRGPALWAEGVTGAGQTIAVLDSGVDGSHPMMAGKIVREACYSTDTFQSFDIDPLCPGGTTQAIGPGSGQNCPDDLNLCFHGTHVAAIAAGKSSAFRGVAHGADIIAIKVVSKAKDKVLCPLGVTKPCAVPFASNVLGGLDRVFQLRRQHHIAAVNLSVGLLIHFDGSCETFGGGEIAFAVNQLRSEGIATIAAAGNNGQLNALQFPACLFQAVAVSASTDSDVDILASSNYSVATKLLAPGQNVTAAVPQGSVLPPGTQCINSGRYCTVTGTSQAAPHVAGAFALLREANPDAKIPEMLSALICTGKAIFRAGMSRPRINVLQAKHELLRADVAERFDFALPSELGSWTQVLGTWRVARGKLSVTAWSNREGVLGEWVMASRKYCSSSFSAQVLIDGIAPESVANHSTGLLLASNISVDGPTISVTGLYFDYNHIGQIKVYRFENTPLKGGTVIGGQHPNPCFTTGSPPVQFSHNLKAVVHGDGEYDFYLDGVLRCEVVERRLPPLTHVAVLALRPRGEAGHELRIHWVDIKPR